jgi:integrase
MRIRRHDKHLPRCVYLRHGAYWFVKGGKWKRLGDNLQTALAEYARIIEPRTGGCDELLDRTLEKSKETIKPSTLEQYTTVCKKLKPILAEFTPDAVESHHVAAILDHHRATPNMANRMLTFMRLAFSNGLTWGMCRTNPCYGVKRHEEKHRDRYLTDAEFAAIKAKAPAALQIVIDVAYFTGQRIGDVLAIRIADVTKDGIAFEQQKTGKRLLVAMTPELEQAVGRAKALHSNVRGLTLFHGRGGKPLSYFGVRSAFDRACKAAGIEDTTLHDLRAKAATDAKKQGLSATALLGHSTESTTTRYLRNRDYVVVNGPSIGQVLDNWTKDGKKSTA